MTARTVRSKARGHWREILSRLGITVPPDRKRGPCPICGCGKDRFRFDDKEGRGTWFCNVCRAGDGVQLVQHVKELDLETAIRLIATVLPEEKGVSPPSETRATAQPVGCTLHAYAEAKGLPVDFLKEQCRLTDKLYQDRPALRIPYLNQAGQEIAVRFRIALDRDGDPFRWKSGSKTCLYGQWRLPGARKEGSITLCEGESDCQTLWFHGFPAIGIPGSQLWKEERDTPLLQDIPHLYVVIEPDKGGQDVLTWLSRSCLRGRIKLIRMTVDAKDPSAFYLSDPTTFRSRWEQLVAQAQPWTDLETEQRQQAGNHAWPRCVDLARSSSILVEVPKALGDRLVGVDRHIKLVYLILVTRLFDRPVSLAVKGPSGGGKSYLVEVVLLLFPASAFLVLNAMSERLLAYTEESLQHRFLVLVEAAGMEGELVSYFIRSLLSEGKIKYGTVEATSDGIKSKILEKPGPTGLLVTTTKVTLHKENETRFFSLAVVDTPAQTTAIMEAVAKASETDLPPIRDLDQWHSLQVWLESGEHRITVPFACVLAKLMKPLAVRLRRDFRAVLTLVKAHALLHRATRARDADGRIMASLEDYKAVYGLVEDLLADELEMKVRQESIDTVQAVIDLNDEDGVTITAVAKKLDIDKSSASRRVNVCVEAGWLVNKQDRKGQPAQLVIGDALPGKQDLTVLPGPEALTQELASGCTVARENQGGDTPFSSVPDDDVLTVFAGEA